MPRRQKHRITQDFKPGPIGWARRRVLPQLARGAALLGILLLAAWITGRVLTDEHHWSQYLYWSPPILMIGGAWLMLLISVICAGLARRLGGLLLRPVLLLLVMGCTVYLLLSVWRVQRFVTSSDTKSLGSIRVLHWNHGGKTVYADTWGEQILDLDTDIVLIANAEWGESRQSLLEEFESFAPDERVRWVNYSYRLYADPAHYRVEGGALIASRYPMTRTGMVRFGEGERQQVMNHSSSDIGWVLFAEFDLDPERTDDEPLVVWFVDLPSNPTVWKMEEMRSVRGSIGSWDGTGWEMGRHVWEQYSRPGDAFPEADLIVGDFNTPRGSASLNVVAPGYADAFDRAGYGRARSYSIRNGTPTERLVYTFLDMHIDLALVAPQHDVTYYELLDTDEVSHLPQIFDIVLGVE